MSLTRFETLLERTMGLKASLIGPSAIERAVGARTRACAIDGLDAYWDRLQRSPDELQALIETVVVPETWFFRDPEAFAAMARIVAAQWQERSGLRPFRLLSLPCSTGEEPFTMAMALLDSGLPARQFLIDAVDISERALSLAHRGIYGNNSFRTKGLDFRARYFDKVDGGYRINDAVRAPVRLAHGNMLEPGFLQDRVPYDIIFCRNLLIYFDADTQARAIGVLQRLLAPQGTLFVGHSEAGTVSAQGLVSARIPLAFAFRSPDASVPAGPSAGAKPPLAARPVRSSPAGKPALAAANRARPAKGAPPAANSETPPGLDQLRQLADGGELEHAARGCEDHLRRNGASSEALLLLAIINDAAGQAAAAEANYRKALYLDPANPEALDHLTLLLRKQGDHAAAQLLADRKRRLADRRAG